MRKEKSLAACLVALIFAIAGSFVGPARAQAGGEPVLTGVLQDSFVLYQNEKGEMACRVATPAERERIGANGATHVIYRGAPVRRKVTGYGYDVLEYNSAQDTSGLALLPSAGLTIVLQGTAQLEANPVARNAFIVAANRWESIISTPVTITLSVDYGPQFFGQNYAGTGIAGSTESFGVVQSLASVRGRLINNSNPTASELQLYNALPADSVPAEFNGSTVNVSNVILNTSQARALGFNVAPGPDARIGFNSNFANGGKFDFDPADGITAGFHDFEAAAAHEIGHALGFASANGGSSSAALTIWDLFRFRPGTANAGNFGSALRVLTKGGTQVMFGNFTSTFASQELGLSTGGPNPPPGDTDDGRQSSHWKDDQLFSTRPFIGIMDQTLSLGIRRTITENDIRTVDLIGYSVVFAPPRPSNDSFANAAVAAGASGSAQGDSTWATREAGEPPTQAGFTGDKSVWFAWTAPATGTATFDTEGSSYDTTLGVYTGNSVGTLTACSGCQNDDAESATRSSRVTFDTTAGTVYYIDVDGWNGAYGSVKLNWTSTITQPLNVSVTGRVVEDAQGLAGVFVGLYDDSGALLQQTTTGADGRWTFASVGVSRGYALAFVKSGYTLTPTGFPIQVGTSALDVGDVTAVKANPIEETSFFVAQHYRDFLGREADASGLAFWTNEIEQCGIDRGCREVKRINVSAAFFLSIEFQGTGGFVYRTWTAAFGPTRIGSTVPLTLQEFLPDAQQVGSGVVIGQAGAEALLESNKQVYLLQFVQRAAFTAQYPNSMTPAQFADALNANTGNSLANQQRNDLVAQLAANNTTQGRADVLRQVVDNTAFQARERNRSFVLMQYFGYLRRDPDAAPDTDFSGYNFWLGKLNEFGGNFIQAEMVKAFLSADEYRKRFGQ
ncbi:MAG TPA: NF038122 family metalloprotease [Pyrinomonadaceae bacterium]